MTLLRPQFSTVYTADAGAVAKLLPPDSVHCVVTSPPYWMKRVALPPDHPDKALEVGGEPKFRDYIDHLVYVFGEVRKVLRPDGVCWINIDDSYSGRRGSGRPSPTAGAGTHSPISSLSESEQLTFDAGLGSKQLCLLPERLAIALQDDGWIIRCILIWHKPGANLFSGRDRPPRKHEYIIMATKSRDYWFNEVSKWESSVLTIAHSRFRGGHYATFPIGLPRRLIDASTPPYGVCPTCGAPVNQVIHRHRVPTRPARNNKPDIGQCRDPQRHVTTIEPTALFYFPCGHEGPFEVLPSGEFVTQGTEVSSEPPTVPAVVLDPFCGAGTTGVAAHFMGRSFIGLELAPDIADLARHRIEEEQPKTGGKL